MCSPTWKHISLVICVLLPGKHINLYLLNSVIGSPNICPLLDSDLSGGLGYPAFEQLGPGRHVCLQAGFC